MFFLDKIKNIYFLIIIIFFSFFFNWYYGFVGFSPPDSFAVYYSGYLILKGLLPFKDYWTTTGPVLDYLQSFFFLINGINWSSYILHSSILNSILACFVFFTLIKFKLSNFKSLIYAILTSLICYPVVGVPFADHHAAIFCIIAMLLFILAINFNKAIYWILIPIVLLIGFLSKQVPSVYFFFIISFLVVLNNLKNRNFKNFNYLISSSIFCIFFLCFFLFWQKIKFLDFFNQYFLFSSSVGTERLNSNSFLTPFTFSRYILKFKFIHLSYIFLLVLIIKHFFKKILLEWKDLIIILTLILSAYALIIHQQLTQSLKFIFFIIPILIGFSEIFINKYLIKKKFINYFLMFLLFVSVSNYSISYVFFQKFKLSCGRKINIYSESVHTNIIDNITNVSWITCLDKNPKKELKNIENILDFLQKETRDSENYLLVTDYLFFFTKLKKNNFISLNKWYHPSVSYPLKNNKAFEYYKNYLFDKLKDNKVKFIIFSYPSVYQLNNQNEFKKLFIKCLKDQRFALNNKIYIFNIENCF